MNKSEDELLFEQVASVLCYKRPKGGGVDNDVFDGFEYDLKDGEQLIKVEE